MIKVHEKLKYWRARLIKAQDRLIAGEYADKKEAEQYVSYCRGRVESYLSVLEMKVSAA